LINQADIKSAGGVAPRVRTQGVQKRSGRVESKKLLNQSQKRPNLGAVFLEPFKPISLNEVVDRSLASSALDRAGYALCIVNANGDTV
jgi:hypothetical protein